MYAVQGDVEYDSSLVSDQDIASSITALGIIQTFHLFIVIINLWFFNLGGGLFDSFFKGITFNVC